MEKLRVGLTDLRSVIESVVERKEKYHQSTRMVIVQGESDSASISL